MSTVTKLQNLASHRPSWKHRTKNGKQVAAVELAKGEEPLFPSGKVCGQGVNSIKVHKCVISMAFSVALDCSGVLQINLGDGPFAHPPGSKGKEKEKKKKKKGKKKSPRGENDDAKKASETTPCGNETPRDVKARSTEEESADDNNKGKEKCTEKEVMETEKETTERADNVAPDSAALHSGWHLPNAYTLVYTPPCDWPKAHAFAVKVIHFSAVAVALISHSLWCPIDSCWMCFLVQRTT